MARNDEYEHKELERVLVLNKGWMPISTRTVEVALSRCIKGTAVIVDHETFEIFTWERWFEERSVPLTAKVETSKYLRTSKLYIRKPEVIALTKYSGYMSHTAPFSRAALWVRDRNQCQYCGKYPKKADRTIDHIIPVSRGGKTTWDNCVLSCLPCNTKKGDRLLSEINMKLLSVPTRPTKAQKALGGYWKESWTNFLPKTDQELRG